MGKSSTETVREIEDLRDRIEGNFRELEERMPQAGIWLKRALGLALTATGVFVLRGVVKAIRSRRSADTIDDDSWVLVRAGDLQKMNGKRRLPVVVEQE